MKPPVPDREKKGAALALSLCRSASMKNQLSIYPASGKCECLIQIKPLGEGNNNSDSDSRGLPNTYIYIFIYLYKHVYF